MISTTRMPPMSACSCTLLIARSMKTALSCVTNMRMPGHLAVDALDLLADACGDLHGVLARLLLDLDLDARLAVDPHEVAALLGGVLHLGDVAQVDRHAVARQDDEIADVLEALELALAAEQIGRVALIDLAERGVLVLLAQRLRRPDRRTG